MKPNLQYPAYLTAAARTTGQNGASIDTTGYRGVRAVVDITDIHAVTPAVTFTIQGQDPAAGGAWYTLLASTALGAVATTPLVVYPGCVAVANSVANLPLPKNIRVIAAVGDADACTYTVSVELIP